MTVMAHDHIWKLTDAEKDVLTLIACGMNNKEIASARGVSLRTIVSMAGRIFSKLQVQNRVQAARWAWGTGLISLDEAAKAAGIDRERRDPPFSVDDRVLVFAFAPLTSDEAMTMAQMYFDWAMLLMSQRKNQVSA